MKGVASVLRMRQGLVLCVALATTAAMCPSPAVAASAWGSAAYGDPPGWCTRYSDMWTATIYTNDPSVATNPERDTFYGFHPNPGYDDWYGFFYGDFRGAAGDTSGWVKLLHEQYPSHYHWNFADYGWHVHGHVKQYIAYYNWTFGGQCGLGRYGDMSPPPYMADQYGWPVVDIYVDAMPPFPPVPRVVAATPTSVSFTWDPVADQGDGTGRDQYTAGVDHYASWLTINGRSGILQSANTAAPRTIVQPLPPGEQACVHVQAFDRVKNGTADQVLCATAATPPPIPDWGPPASRVNVDPPAVGLAGFEAWLWLWPQPRRESIQESYLGAQYLITAVPIGVQWDFGDGTDARIDGLMGFGRPFPAPSQVTHVYSTQSRGGYQIRATVRYEMSWSMLAGGEWVGPYPLGTAEREVRPLPYPVVQAQPELIRLSD